MVPVNLRYLHARRHSQRFRNARGSGPADVFLCDYKNRCGCLQNLLWIFRNGGDLDVAEFFQAQLLQGVGMVLVGLRVLCSSRPTRQRETKKNGETT